MVLQWPFIGFIKASSNCSGHESRSLRTGRTVDTVKAAWITSAGILEKMEFDAYGRQQVHSFGDSQVCTCPSWLLLTNSKHCCSTLAPSTWTSQSTFIVGLPSCKLSLETLSLSPLGVCLTYVLAVSQTNQVDNQK